MASGRGFRYVTASRPLVSIMVKPQPARTREGMKKVFTVKSMTASLYLEKGGRLESRVLSSENGSPTDGCTRSTGGVEIVAPGYSLHMGNTFS